jgi:hypothetical protein
MDNLTFLAYITHQYLYAQFEKKQKLQSQIDLALDKISFNEC